MRCWACTNEPVWRPRCCGMPPDCRLTASWQLPPRRRSRGAAAHTLCTLLQNSRSVMVQGRWWWPWNAAIWSPNTGVELSP